MENKLKSPQDFPRRAFLEAKRRIEDLILDAGEFDRRVYREFEEKHGGSFDLEKRSERIRWLDTIRQFLPADIRIAVGLRKSIARHKATQAQIPSMVRAMEENRKRHRQEIEGDKLSQAQDLFSPQSRY